MSVISLNKNLAIKTTLGALAVVAGVIIKNSSEQMNLQNPMIDNVGKGLFILGWICLGFALAMNANGSMNYGNMSLIGMVGAAAITFAVMQMKDKMARGEPVGMLPMVFIGGWIAFIGAMFMRRSSGRPGLQMLMGMTSIVALAGVFGGMLVSLPQQRERCIVDGPGMPMFMITWMAVIFLNSVSAF